MISIPRVNDPDYILNRLPDDIGSISMEGEKIYYPSCGSSCVDENMLTIPGSNYILPDGRCFKAVNACDKYDCLAKIENSNNTDLSIGGNFSSCITTFDTRIPGIKARYIRIEKGTSLYPVSIVSIEAYDIYGTYIPPILGRAFPVDGDNYGKNLLNKNVDKIAKTLNQENAYVQIDLGKNHDIYLINIINTEPISNIVGNNLVMIDDNKVATFKYPINFPYTRYLITTKYDIKYIPDKNETIVFEPYKYPSCIEEGCVNGTVLPGYKFMLDRPLPERDEDLLIPYDNRCFSSSNKCDFNCLDKIIKGELIDTDINQFFVTCDDSINTLMIRIEANFIRLERTFGTTEVELSQIEIYDGPHKYAISEIKSYPYDNKYPLNNIIDNLYTNVVKTKPQLNSHIQVEVPIDTTMTHVYISIPEADVSKLIGTTLFVVNKYDIIIHSFTFTDTNISTVEQVSKKPSIKTFKIITNGTGSFIKMTKDMQDTYNYPQCLTNGCTTRGIIGSKYNLPGGRCVVPITDCDTCLDKVSTNNMSIEDIEKNYMSCSDNTDTRVFASNGRYVRIQRDDTNTGFDLNEIAIFGQGELNINVSNAYPVNVINNNLMPAKNAYDKTTNTYASVRDTTTLQKPYMQFDLGSNKMISSINLLSYNASINGSTLYILSENNEIIYSKKIVDVIPNSVYKINTASIGLSSTLQTMSTVVIYAYPDCIKEGCMSDGHFIIGQRYEDSTKGTCFIAKSEDPKCYTNINKLYGSDMDNCFDICGSTDTRYPPSLGRFVRIRNNSSSVMTISELSALNNSNAYPIINAFSKGVTGITARSDGIINKTGETSVTGVNSYVQIDLGQNQTITDVKIAGTIGNSVIEIINDSGLVVSSTNISNPGIYSGRSNIMQTIVNPGIEESFEYPACEQSTTFRDCVDIAGKTKPLFKYNTTSGSCGIAKVPCDSCLTKLKDGTLTTTEADTYFKSCNSGETRYPTLRGRYIRLQSNGVAFKVQKLEAFEKSDSTVAYTVVNTIAYPSNSDSSNLVTGLAYTNVLTNTDVSYAQIDLGMDKVISKVNVKEVVGDTSLGNVILYIIDEAGNTVYQLQLQATNNNITPAKLPGTFAKQTLTNTFTYPDCITSGCLTSGNQILGQQYNIGGRCFKAVNNSPDSTCLSKATTLYGVDMDNCFESCGSSIDTRYNSLTGQYIRLTRLTSSELKLSEMKAKDSSGNDIPIISTYAKGCTNILNRSDNINVADKYVSITGLNSYIQVMLGNNTLITSITLSVPTGNTFANLVGSVLQVLNNTGKIVYEYNITSSTQQLSDTTKTFNVRNNKDGLVLPISEEFSYPACLTDSNFECVSSSGMPKPNFKYNLSNNRCVTTKQPCTVADCMSKLNANTLTPTEINTNFIPCDITRFSQYPTIIGRYIRLERDSSSNNGFGVKSIEAYGVTKLTPSHTRSYPLSSNNYSKYMADVTSVVPTIVDNGIPDDTGTIVKPFVQLDYSDNQEIRRIVITTNNDLTLNNTILKVINKAGDTVYQTPVTITSNNNVYTFYTVDIPGTEYVPSTLVNKFRYDTCVSKGCVDDNNQIENQLYTTADGRCLKAKGYLPVSQCLSKLSTLSATEMDTCFDKCGTTETRYPSLVARFIRIRQNNNRSSDIKLYKLIANGIDSSGQSTPFNIVTKHCKPILHVDNRSDNLNRTGLPAGTTGVNAYIQIDLGENKNIKTVDIKWLGSITGTEVIIIAQDYSIKYSKILSETIYETTGEITLAVNNNVLESDNLPAVNIMETYNYPDSKNVYNDGLDENNRPKLLFKYILNNGLSVINTKQCSINDCLSLVLNNTMTWADMETYFTTTEVGYDTRFPNPTCKYIKIEKNTNTSFSVSSITFKNVSSTGGTSTVLPSYTLVYPKSASPFTVGQVSTPVDSGSPTTPFILFTFNNEQKIRFIDITIANNSLNDSTIYIIDSVGNTVVQKVINNIVVGTNSIEFLMVPGATKTNPIMSYKFAYTGCASIGCITDDGRQYKNQMYTTADGRCLKALDYSLVSQCLGNVQNLAGTEMDNCFDKCGTSETRYPSLTGRFVRLRQGPNRIANMKLLKLIAKAGDTAINIVTRHCKPIIDISLKSDNLNGTAPAGATGIGAYIQIDLGSEVLITSVVIKRFESIDNTELLVLDRLGNIKHSTIITDSLFTTSDEITLSVNLNVPASAKLQPVTIMETYNYPKTVYDGGLDENDRPKLLFKYILSNGLSVINIKQCTNDCLSFVNSNTMSWADMETYFLSTEIGYDTRFPNPTCKYLRIQRTGTSSIGFNITGIIVKDTNANDVPVAYKIVYPLKSGYSTSDITGTLSPNEPSKPFVQLEFTNTAKIRFITIQTADTTLNNSTLYLIDADGITVYQKALTNIISGDNKIETLRIPSSTLDAVTMYYKFKYDSCAPIGCISDGKQYDKQMYETSDGRCFKAIGNKSIIDCLSKIVTTRQLYGTNMDACFDKCGTTETRYPPVNGRYIRLLRPTGLGDVSLASLFAYSTVKTVGSSALTPISAHVKNPKSNTTKSDKLIDGLPNTEAVCLSTGYIQIDLGEDKPIRQIELISLASNSSTLQGTKLIIIEGVTNKIRSEVNFDSTFTATNNSVIVDVFENIDGSIVETSESYTWPCIDSDCTSASGQVKPKFKYTLSDGRCLISKNTGNSIILSDVVNYNNVSDADILTNFDSCNANYKTQFNVVIGRYIRIRKIPNASGVVTNSTINIAEFIVKDKSGALITNTSLNSYAKPLQKLADNTYSYGKYMLDNNLATSTITNSTATEPQLDTSLDVAYVQVDLDTDKEIGYIELKHNGDTIAATSLNDTELIIVNNANEIRYRQNIPISSSDRTIYIQSKPVTAGYTFNNSEVFNYPGCTGCLTYDGRIIPEFRYNTTDGRCFKSKNYNPVSILDRAINRDSTLNINTYFAQCGAAETRYTPTSGRFIRIERNDNINIKLSQFEVRNTSGLFIKPVDIHVKPFLTGMLSSYQKLLLENANTDVSTDVNPSTSTSKLVYIQLDLGSDITIKEIRINPFSTDSNGVSFLNGSILYIINQNSTIQYSVPLNSTTLTTSTFTVY